jgi:hypothetical protein
MSYLYSILKYIKESYSYIIVLIVYGSIFDEIMKENMEQWEKDLREKLERELPSGAYNLVNEGKMFLMTSKLGWIDFEVAMRKDLIKAGLKTKDNEKNI